MSPESTAVVEATAGQSHPGTTPLSRFVPALMLSQLGFYVALITPLQLLLTLHLTRIAGAGATTAFGVVTGFGAICAIVFNPVAGRVSDRTRARLGRRRTWILTGSLLLAIALVAMTVTTRVWQVVVLWCAVQAIGNFQYAANNALLADQVPAHRRGGVSGLVGLTAAIGPLAGIAIANRFAAGGAGQWWAVAAVAVVASVLAVLLLRDPPSTAPKPPLDLRTVLTTFWFNPRRHPAFGWAWLVRFLIMCAYAAGSYNAFYLMDRFAVSEQEVGGIVLGLSTVSVACMALSSVVGGYVSDAVKRQKPFVVFAGLVAALALVMMATAGSVTVVYVASALLGLGTGTFLAIDLALCVRVLPNEDEAGKDLAIINIANSLPQSLVPFAAPALLALGGFPALFGTLAVIGVLGAAAITRVPEIGRELVPSRWTAPITRA
jgi:MFS family permease